MNYDRAYYQVAADYIKSRLGGFEPELGIILGTGLGGLAASVEDPIDVSYKDIPNFLVSTAPEHAGKFIFGTLNRLFINLRRRTNFKRKSNCRQGG